MDTTTRTARYGTPRATNPPTDRQVEFLRSLWVEAHALNGIDQAPDVDAFIDALAATPDWDRTAVSRIIDGLIAAVRAAESRQPDASPVRPNNYPGRCAKCSGRVEARAGALVRTKVGGWAVEHVGDCPERPAPEALPDVAAGHYAIASNRDGIDLDFYRVDRPDSGQYAGRTFVKQVIGGRPHASVRRDAVPSILARIAADPDAGPRYGREIGRCCRCNRHLTDATSRAAGIGPDCAGR